jgi:hypothetical protein
MKACALCIASLFFGFIAYGQGTVFFGNFPYFTQPQLFARAPVYFADGVTPLSGPQFSAQLLEGPDPNDLLSVATTGFLTGQLAGYFATNVTINGVAPQTTTWVQVRVWNSGSGASFLQAEASGLPNSWWQSSTFSIVTGDSRIPGILVGLGTSPVELNSVPEPSAAALVGLGAGLMVAWRVVNKSRHRMSGTTINLKTDCQRMPLIGALCRSEDIACG